MTKEEKKALAEKIHDKLNEAVQGNIIMWDAELEIEKLLTPEDRDDHIELEMGEFIGYVATGANAGERIPIEVALDFMDRFARQIEKQTKH